MSQIINARFEDGVLKPEHPLDLVPNERVRLVVVPMSDLGLASVAAWRRPGSNSGMMSDQRSAAASPCSRCMQRLVRSCAQAGIHPARAVAVGASPVPCCAMPDMCRSRGQAAHRLLGLAGDLFPARAGVGDGLETQRRADLQSQLAGTRQARCPEAWPRRLR